MSVDKDSVSMGRVGGVGVVDIGTGVVARVQWTRTWTRTVCATVSIYVNMRAFEWHENMRRGEV